ncbi:MAG: hypothetical protein ACKV2T_24275 [Kofleriaceae bacterium]
MRSSHVAITVLALASCESALVRKSARETECARIRELTKPRRTYDYSKPVPIGAMEWTDPEIRAAVSRHESGTSECVEVGRDGDAPILRCPKTLAQMCGF